MDGTETHVNSIFNNQLIFGFAGLITGICAMHGKSCFNEIINIQ